MPSNLNICAVTRIPMPILESEGLEEGVRLTVDQYGFDSEALLFDFGAQHREMEWYTTMAD